MTCHLGAGASLAAVVGGRSVDTTMGFTPLEGLVMATRSGTVDLGLVLWLEEHEHLSPHEVATALEQDSGLKALAGTGDMREVQAAAQRGDPDAVLALDVYTHRLVGGIAAMNRGHRRPGRARVHRRRGRTLTRCATASGRAARLPRRPDRCRPRLPAVVAVQAGPFLVLQLEQLQMAGLLSGGRYQVQGAPPRRLPRRCTSRSATKRP